MSLLRRLCGIAVMLCIAVAGLPATADDWNKGLEPDDYEMFDTKVKVDEQRPLGARFFFHAGMVAGLQGAKEDYAKAGVAPLYCLPADLKPEILGDLILAELKANPHAWRALHAGAEKLAVYVVRRKYPC